MLNKGKTTTESYLMGNPCPSKLPISSFKLPYPSTITQRANVFTPFCDSKDTEHQKQLELDQNCWAQNFQFYFCSFWQGILDLAKNPEKSRFKISSAFQITTNDHTSLQCGDNMTKKNSNPLSNWLLHLNYSRCSHQSMDNTLFHRFDAKRMQDMPVRLSRWGSDIKVNGSVEEGLSKGDNIKTQEMGHSYFNQSTPSHHDTDIDSR